ncbi:MAG: radical SAM protein [Bacteroidales bacterium]|jgi:pyruvate formate lyase activating enzyme|nr:radical SAM protein [Bacteroidales bacterium]
MSLPYIFDIQRFSIHDGPGIRTTVFFKGCPLRCAWCHNPEGRVFLPEYRTKPDGRLETVGKQYSVKTLVGEIEKDIIFYEQSGGGVTLSGGEVMAQNMDYIANLIKTLYGKGISVAVDTCGYCDFERFERILPYTDFFLYDLKLLDDAKHQYYTAVSNEIILENLRKLSGRKAKIHLRLIMLESLNTDDEHVVELKKWLNDNNIRTETIDLLPYHELGKQKHRRLQSSSPKEEQRRIFRKPAEERLEEIKRMLRGI